jgi:hypothetical protein
MRMFLSKDITLRKKIPELTPEYVIEKIKQSGFDKINHIHIYFQNLQDHIVLICHENKFKKIVVKTSDCKSSTYGNWADSCFSKYSQESVLVELSNLIDRIEIDTVKPKKTWYYEEFFE